MGPSAAPLAKDEPLEDFTTTRKEWEQQLAAETKADKKKARAQRKYPVRIAAFGGLSLLKEDQSKEKSVDESSASIERQAIARTSNASSGASKFGLLSLLPSPKGSSAAVASEKSAKPASIFLPPALRAQP